MADIADMADTTVVPYDAVILAGGRAARLGGLDKPGEPVGGRPLIERVAAAVPGARKLVVVGPRRSAVGGPDTIFVMEDPAGAGPVAALRAGLPLVMADWVALLAADLPFLAAGHVSALFKAAAGIQAGIQAEIPGDTARAPSEVVSAGAVLVDDSDRDQWLTGVWRTQMLREALAGYAGRSLYGLLGPLRPVRLFLPPDGDGCAPWFDCDTMDDLGIARKRA
jgi:molybdopterin-guanine dinucleotide biosynthesis protein A